MLQMQINSALIDGYPDFHALNVEETSPRKSTTKFLVPKRESSAHEECSESTLDSLSIISECESQSSVHWLKDTRLADSPVSYLTVNEEKFWIALIAKYLHPIEDDMKEKVCMCVR